MDWVVMVCSQRIDRDLAKVKQALLDDNHLYLIEVVLDLGFGSVQIAEGFDDEMLRNWVNWVWIWRSVIMVVVDVFGHWQINKMLASAAAVVVENYR